MFLPVFILADGPVRLPSSLCLLHPRATRRLATVFNFTFPNRRSLIKQKKAMGGRLRATSMNIRSSIPLVVTSALVIFSPLQEGGTTHVAQMIIRFLILAWAGGALAVSIQHGRLAVPVLSIRYVTLAFLGFAVIATLFSPMLIPVDNGCSRSSAM